MSEQSKTLSGRIWFLKPFRSGIRKLIRELRLHEIERIKLHRQRFAVERPVAVADFV